MAKNDDAMEEVIRRLESRLAKLEQAVHHSQTGSAGSQSSGTDTSPGASPMDIGHCTLPQVPDRKFGSDVSPFRESLIRYIGKKWVNGTKLKYYFIEDGVDRGNAANVDLVRRAFDAWKEVGIGIEFEETSSIDNAQVRIGFRRGDGAWSYVGRDVIDIPGRYERTMNFGWDLTRDPRGGGLDTPIHEIGHTLGFPHEHQNPFAGIVWNEEVVYRTFGGPPNNWPRDQVYHNILRKLSTSEVEGSNWDPNSIMHYAFPAGLIDQPIQYRNGLTPMDGLTDTDRERARTFYPAKAARKFTVLKPFQLESLSLKPGEQKNFEIIPERSDEFTIQTFGRSDSVMVLFEDVNGEEVFVAGDDDSGTNLNAKITTRLVQGRRYVLRIRLYLNWASGDTAVMLW